MATEDTLQVPAATGPRLWRRRSVRDLLSRLVSYALLIGLGIIVLMPLSWMLTAALRGQGEPVYTIPPSWFPTDSFHFENFLTVLTNEAYPLWRPLLNTLYLVVLNITGVVISNTLVSTVPGAAPLSTFRRICKLLSKPFSSVPRSQIT